MIDRLAREGNPRAFHFSKPKTQRPYQFSFSGIKTAVLHLVQGNGQPRHRERVGSNKKLKDTKWVKDVCASFQRAVVDWLSEETFRACEARRIKTIVIGGGVSANSRLRAVFAEGSRLRGYDVYIPPLEFTTDNALMIARAGYERFRAGARSGPDLTADPNLPWS
jgi:N6-L-threonylcarbamoyladenine synthase